MFIVNPFSEWYCRKISKLLKVYFEIAAVTKSANEDGVDTVKFLKPTNHDRILKRL